MYEKISLSIVVISLITISLTYINYKKAIYDITTRERLPELLLRFPVAQTSQKSYQKTINKVDYFLKSTEKGNQVELKLSTQELNYLYTQGNPINIYLPGKYLYYEIENNCIIEHLIEWPLFDLRPCFQRKKKIVFSIEENKVKINSQHIERYLKKVNDPPFIGDIISCPLIIFILKMSSDPFCLPFRFQKNSYEYNNAKNILDKIKFVNVVNSELILRS